VKAVQLGFSVQYFRFDELITALRADAGMPPARLKRRKYMSTALLLVDELSFEPMTRQEASLFFRLVSYRYGRGAMLITTNKSIRDWTELLSGDEVLATAILDRLLHRSHVLNIKGRSYRLRDLEDALKLAPRLTSAPRPARARAACHPSVKVAVALSRKTGCRLTLVAVCPLTTDGAASRAIQPQARPCPSSLFSVLAPSRFNLSFCFDFNPKPRGLWQRRGAPVPTGLC
jgi:IstB-like ATP binding protein